MTGRYGTGNSGVKQNMGSTGYFMPVSSLMGQIYTITYGSGSGASWQPSNFTATPQVAWFAQYPNAPLSAGNPYQNANGNPYLSSINNPGQGILKDLGKTVVSAGRTFRKIQLVANLPNNSQTRNESLSTNGVAGQDPYQLTGAQPVQDFLTGYIEFGFEGTGPSAPVVPYGRG